MELPKRSHRAEKYNNQLENALEGFNSKLDETEEWSVSFKRRKWNSHPIRQQKERMKKTWRYLGDAWDNICITGVSEGEETKNKAENLFEK